MGISWDTFLYTVITIQINHNQYKLAKQRYIPIMTLKTAYMEGKYIHLEDLYCTYASSLLLYTHRNLNNVYNKISQKVPLHHYFITECQLIGATVK